MVEKVTQLIPDIDLPLAASHILGGFHKLKKMQT